MSARRASGGGDGAKRLQVVLAAGQAARVYQTEDVGVYARPPSTSTPGMAAIIEKALKSDFNMRQINKLLKKNSSNYDGKMILLASAGASKKTALNAVMGRYDPIAEWNSGFLYMAFASGYSNVVNAVNDLNMNNIAHVWLMPDGSIEPVTKESMKPWSGKWTYAPEEGMNVPVHWVDDKGELLPAYTPP